MRTPTRSLAWPVAVMALAGVVLFAFAPRRAAAPPTSVAVVNLGKINEASLEWTARDAARVERAKAFNAELQALAEQIAAKQNDLKMMSPSSPAGRQASVELYKMQGQHRANFQIYQELVDIEKGDLLADMYKKAMSAVEAVATENGWHVVLIDDRGGLPPGRPETELLNVLSVRKVAFAADAVDITDQVITRMNNEFNAGG